MADKSPKIKPATKKTNDFSVDVAYRLPQIESSVPSVTHRLQPQLSPLRQDPGVDLPMASASTTLMTSVIDEVARATLAPSFMYYWLPARKELGEADAQGVRIYKKRQYVAVADDQVVQVVRDVEYGLFRATVASELHASGPLMKPDAEGRFWRPLDSGDLPMPHAVEPVGYLAANGELQRGPLRTIEERLARLYPAMSDEARKALRRKRLMGDPALAMARLEAEYFTLVKDLEVWAAEVPSHHPVTGQALGPDEVATQQAGRALFAQELQANWSRQTTTANPYTPSKLEYDLNILGSMPHLSADFSHVQELSLSSTLPLSDSSFLASFTGVRYLTLSGFALKSFPVEVYQMRELVTLTLDNSDIRLTEATVEGLAHIEGLTFLDLSENPLGLTPDLRFMQRLDSLYLSQTGLTDVPVGLFDIESLAYADLGGNEITSLPQELFDVPDVRKVNYNFRNNPLSEATLQQVTAYIEGAGLDRNILIQVDGEVEVQQQQLPFEGVDSGLESSDEG